MVETLHSSSRLYGFLFFLIYNTDLSDKVVSVTKFFANKTTFFLTKDIDPFTVNLNSDLAKLPGRAFDWKMIFNLDRKKQAQQVIST